jgi:hypothetical protein
MNYANQQELYDFIKQADNASLWSRCGTLAKTVGKLQKREEQHTKEKKKGLDSPPPSLTDKELRTRVKNHLVAKLADGTLGAADIGQLKDIFGLASKAEELTIQVVDYSNAMIDCPHCGVNLDKPSTIVPEV